MHRIRSVSGVLGLVIALFLVMAPVALAKGGNGDEKSAKGQATAEAAKSKAKKSDAKKSGKQADGTPGSTAGTNGNKAEQSETGTKPFDNNPNDHPSGKDRSQEPGGSGTQGKSASDPDGMANGGADKPGGAGGFDSDKDGNNGCGNDDDFEDDNNGWCGKNKDATVTTAPVVPLVADQVIDQPKNTPNVITNPAAPIVHDRVLGTRITRSEAPAKPLAQRAGLALDRVLGSVLPFTGSAGIVSLAIAAIVLIAVGALALRVRRSHL